MGDFSRDTFRLTNALYQALSNNAVTDPRHYVGVRLQQGVPLLDADWNELEDIRRTELELLIRDVIGDGVPGQGEGFSIAPVESDNDFAILPGTLIVGGWQVLNAAQQSYSELPRFDDATSGDTDLTTPVDDRIDVVYLDVWEREIAEYGPNHDDRLVNVRVGMSTAVRQERAWTVRVAEGVEQFEDLTLDEAGHKYYPLARLYRSDTPRIEPYMIEDLRASGLNLADGIKVPMYLRRGGEEVTYTRFSEMLVALRDVLTTWHEDELFPIEISSAKAWFAFTNALNRIYHLTTSAEINSDTRSLDNADGLTVVQKLVDAQSALIETVRDYGSGVAAEMAVMDQYENYLVGSDADEIDGIQPSIDRQDLLGAVQGQEALNEFLGLSTGDLPQGSVAVRIDSVDLPGSVVEAGTPFTLHYVVTSELIVPDTAEVFDLEAVVSDVRWAAALDQTQLTLESGASGEVAMTVTPSETLVSGNVADINLVARAHRRPSIRSVQPAQQFTIGQPPPGQSFFFYSGSIPLESGELHVQPADIEEEIFEIDFTLVNTSGGDQKHTFRIEYELVWPETLPDGVDPNNWIPSELQTIEGNEVTGADTTASIPVRGPSFAGVSEEITFTLQATVTLTHVDDAPISGGASRTVDLPVVVETGTA